MCEKCIWKQYSRQMKWCKTLRCKISFILWLVELMQMFGVSWLNHTYSVISNSFISPKCHLKKLNVFCRLLYNYIVFETTIVKWKNIYAIWQCCLCRHKFYDKIKSVWFHKLCIFMHKTQIFNFRLLTRAFFILLIKPNL